jgi:hypothetical protein
VHSLRRWGRSAIRLPIWLFILAGCVEASGLGFRHYIFPKYPAMANRARIEGSFVVELEVSGRKVVSVRIVSSSVHGIGNREIIGPPPPDFVTCIQDSLSMWELVSGKEDEKSKLQLSITFRLADKTSSGDNVAYTFSVQEKDNLPSNITIEASRLGSDQEPSKTGQLFE